MRAGGFLVVAALVVPGCRQVLGIDDLPAGDDAGDAAVRGALLRHADLHNNPDGQTVIETAPLRDITVTLDGTAAVLDEAGFLALPDDGAPHALGYTTPSAVYDYQGTASSLVLPADQLGRLSTVPMATSSIRISTTTGTSVALYSTGLFAASGVGALTAGVLTMSASGLAPLFGSTNAIDPAEGDRIHVLTYKAVPGMAGSPGYSVVAGFGTTELDLAHAGSMNKLELVDRAVEADQCGTVHSEHAVEVARVTAAGYPAPAGSSEWSVLAEPAPELAYSVGALLAFADPAPGTSGDATFQFANPLPGHTAMLFASAVGTRTLTAANGSVGVAMGTFVWNRVATTCATASVTPLPAGGVALPSRVSVGGAVIGADGDVVELGSADADTVIAWELVDDGPVDRYTVRIFDLGSGAVPTLTQVGPAILTTAPEAHIPLTRLEKSHLYTVQVTATHGYADAAGGDLATIAYPFAAAIYYSPAFEVQQVP